MTQKSDASGRLAAARGFVEAKRMRDAIDVALTLLDEMFELLPREPPQAVAQDIADIFHEISELAARAQSATRTAMVDETDDISRRR